MNNKDIEAKIIEVVAKQLDVDQTKISSDSNFIDDLGADSLDTVELVMVLEEEFSQYMKDGIPDEETEKLKTVGDVTRYIAKRANELGK